MREHRSRPGVLLSSKCLRYTVAAVLSLAAAYPEERGASRFEQRIWKGDFVQTRPMGTAVRLLSWNIERGLRLAEIAATIEREAPGICLLQEVDVNAGRTGRRNIGEALARQLCYNYAAAAEFQELSQGKSGSPAFQGQAILTLFPLRSVRVIRFEHQSEFWRPRWYLPNWSLFQRRLGGRIAQVAELGDPAAPLVVYNVHLESRGSERLCLLQLEEVLADAARYPDTTPLVIAGDFNTASRALIGHIEEAGFKGAIESPAVTTKRGKILDWIFVRRLSFRNGTVHSDVRASDHYPLTVDLLLQPE